MTTSLCSLWGKKCLTLTRIALDPALGNDMQTSHKGRLVLNYKNLSGIRRRVKKLNATRRIKRSTLCSVSLTVWRCIRAAETDKEMPLVGIPISALFLGGGSQKIHARSWWKIGDQSRLPKQQLWDYFPSFCSRWIFSSSFPSIYSHFCFVLLTK